MDRLTSMEVFVAAVDLGSFAAAATELGMSAPMVDPASGSSSLTLRLVARRHVDLHRVSSALCQPR